MKSVLSSLLCFLFLTFYSCDTIKNSNKQIEEEVVINNNLDETLDTTPIKTFNILALGDSYTIGQNVCETCRFPAQLLDSLEKKTADKNTFNLKIVATTGWTTTNLISAIHSENLTSTYNLVTLLIGVNNQYQKKPFSVYENEFPVLVSMAVQLANNTSNKVVVLSIPDYAFTPFGKGNTLISEEIKKYNDFAKNYCIQKNISFLNITDITEMGLINSALVASDGLHPSELAYAKFVERLLPIAIEKLALK